LRLDTVRRIAKHDPELALAFLPTCRDRTKLPRLSALSNCNWRKKLRPTIRK
jgi:hypothetical protein